MKMLKCKKENLMTSHFSTLYVLFLLHRFWMSTLYFFPRCISKILHLRGNHWQHSVLQMRELGELTSATVILK